MHGRLRAVRSGLLWGLLLLALGARAHEVRPAYLELAAGADGSVHMTWKLPVLGGRMLPLTPRMPAQCRRDAAAEPDVLVTADARLERSLWHCGSAGMEQGSLGIDGLSMTFIDVLVRLERPGRDPATFLLKPTAPTVDLAESAPAAAAVSAYLGLGIEHILFGLDHLAFVLGLLVLVRDRWMLLKTITAFTIAHSITLGVATFGWVNAPSGTVETMIALSILLLAVEIVHREQGRDVLTARIPWLVAFVFGLLHGFGFAGALARIGLPHDAIPLALLLFNVGVELGQLLFVAVVLVCIAALRERHRWGHLGPTAAAWLIGVPAAYWSIQRIAGILSGI